MIDTPAAATTWKVGDTITFSGHATDRQQGTLPASAPDVVARAAALPVARVTSTRCRPSRARRAAAFVAPDHEYPSHLELRLTATDSGGLTQHHERSSSTPRPSASPSDRIPTGLTLAVGSTSQPTPFTRTAIVGSTLSVSAPSPQAIGGTAYEFVSWSDGGAQTHTIVANASGSYPATYQVRPGGPVISQVSSRSGPGRVTITWTTDVAADSQVQYGLTTAYGSSTALDRTLVTSHSVTITNLPVRRKYFFQVSSRDLGEPVVRCGQLPHEVARVPAAAMPVSSRDQCVLLAADDPDGGCLPRFLSCRCSDAGGW